MRGNPWPWDWQEGLKCQAQGSGEPWRSLSRGGIQSDMEASDKARQAGGGRLGGMMHVWLWGERGGRCRAREGPESISSLSACEVFPKPLQPLASCAR